MGTVPVLLSNVLCKTCVGVEVFAPVSVFRALEALEQLPTVCEEFLFLRDDQHGRDCFARVCNLRACQA